MKVPRWLCTVILRWAHARGRRRPYYHLPGYMERWWVLGGSHPGRDERPDDVRGWPRGRFDAFIGRYFSIRLHHILSSDKDRHLHDHTCPFASLILRGAYFDVVPLRQAQDCTLDSVPGETRWDYYEQGDIARHEATDRHRLVLHHGTVWSLFVQFGKQGAWGFYVPVRGKVPAAEYLAEQRS